ncbi:DUF6745 domain-containing protein [Nocardia aurantia]|uniref:DUF6745 domain-containing protein n=1 Tax=Nocardia aurantia TaxID=2585199 RepID=A0A7K0DYA5_9NOCA|nr:hypothetical protein [Nocardia aurantia]MQY30528.1 hypothetical protein [Nocardia aurantia]
MSDIDAWRAVAVAAATGPADRPAAETAVREAYRAAGLAEPAGFVWADSPLSGVLALADLDAPGRSVREDIRTLPWAAERRRLHDELGPAGWTELWHATGGHLWDTTRLLTDRLRAGVVAAMLESGRYIDTDPAAAEAEVRGLLLDAVLGQHEAPWLAAFDDRAERLSGLAGVARAAGWWWPFEHVVVLCERPSRLLRDEAGRLHAADGPAVLFPDGFALHAWHGMPVHTDFLAGLSTLTPARIRGEENAELRRVLLEHYGYDRYLAESGAEPVHRDETGILWRIPLSDDEDVVMVEVVNSTPEPDGTHHTYWLRVPPETQTARAGVAWTFDLDAADYAPLQQT